MATSGTWCTPAHTIMLVPFLSFNVIRVHVIKCRPLVADSPVASEDVDLAFVEAGGVVGAGLGRADFAFGVLGLIS